MIMQNYDKFAGNFVMAYKTKQGVFVPNLKLFGQTKTELQTKKVAKIFYYVIWENGLVGIPLPTNMATVI